MEHPFLNWAKKYGLNPSDEIIDFVISYKSGSFKGDIVYFERNNFRIDKSKEPAFNLIIIPFFDVTKEGIIEQFKSWIKYRFNKEFDIIEKK